MDSNHTTVRSPIRSGTILIMVAGISALLASLALTFLVRMRSDIEESQQFLAQTQARMMLAAAMNYLSETSRVGWDDPATPQHEEAYGWVDVRDGSVGPRDRSGKALYQAEIDPALGKGTRWPAVGSSTICSSTHLWTRPPTAISPNVAPNPIRHEPTLAWHDLVAFPNASPAPVSPDFAAFLAGDSQPRIGTNNPCWFRLYRHKPAVFIITCGTGASGGYRTWDEVVAAGAEPQFGSREFWQMLRQGEPVLWFEVEWNPAVSTTSSAYLYHADRSIRTADGNSMGQLNRRNQMGTFLYIQRLMQEPGVW